MADNGLMPKGLLNESIAALDISSVLSKAQIMDFSAISSASAMLLQVDLVSRMKALMTLLRTI